MCSWHENRWWERQGMVPDSHRAISQNWRKEKELKVKACPLTFSMGWSSLLPKGNRQKWSRGEGGEETVVGRERWACDPSDCCSLCYSLYREKTGKFCPYAKRECQLWERRKPPRQETLRGSVGVHDLLHHCYPFSVTPHHPFSTYTKTYAHMNEGQE